MAMRLDTRAGRDLLAFVRESNVRGDQRGGAEQDLSGSQTARLCAGFAREMVQIRKESDRSAGAGGWKGRRRCLAERFPRADRPVEPIQFSRANDAMTVGSRVIVAYSAGPKLKGRSGLMVALGVTRTKGCASSWTAT